MSYIEEYVVIGRPLGIDFDEEECKYRMWVGGCVVGRAETIERARELLLIYMIRHIEVTIEGMEERLEYLKQELRELKLHPARLLHFVTAYATQEEEGV